MRAEEAPSTGEGKIVGTVAYMSPEQAQGKRVDARSDIFSFGSLLYEMITGRRAFQGDTKVSTLAAILKEEPKAASQLVDGLPKEVGRLISRCLRKDLERRFQHMKDLKVELEELREESDSGTLEAGEPVKPKLHRGLLWSAAVVTVTALAMTGIWFLRSRAPKPEEPLAAVPLTSYPGREDSPSFSPDGTQVAFEWRPEGPGETSDVYVKQIGVEPPSRLTDTPAWEYNPAWSPDGRTIAFLRQMSPKATNVSNVSLVLIPQRVGRERVLAEFDWSTATERLLGPYLAWTPDSKWLICPVCEAGKFPLYMVSVQTGEQRRLTSPPADALGDVSPAVSPDGRTLAFARESSVAAKSDLYLLRLGEDYTPLAEPRRVHLDNSWSFEPSWTPDGNDIVFSSSSGTRTGFSLWRMVVSKPGMPRMLAFAQGNAFEPTVSRPPGICGLEICHQHLAH